MDEGKRQMPSRRSVRQPCARSSSLRKLKIGSNDQGLRSGWSDRYRCLLVAQVKWALSDKRERRVALKIINKKRAPVDFQQKFLPRELETMKLLNHPNIIKLYEVIYVKDKVIFFYSAAILFYIYVRPSNYRSTESNTGPEHLRQHCRCKCRTMHNTNNNSRKICTKLHRFAPIFQTFSGVTCTLNYHN